MSGLPSLPPLSDFTSHSDDPEFLTAFNDAKRALAVTSELDTNIVLHHIGKRINTIQNSIDRSEYLYDAGKISLDEYNKVLQLTDQLDPLKQLESRVQKDGDILSHASDELLRATATGPREIASKAVQAAIDEHQQTVDKIIKDIADGEKSLADNTTLIDSTVAEIDTTLAATDEANRVWNHLRDIGADAEEIREAEAEVDRLSLILSRAVETSDKLYKIIEKTKTGLFSLKSKLQTANQLLQKAKIYEGGSKVTNAVIKQVAETIASYTDPLMKFGKSMEDSFKIIQGGYTKLAEDLIEGGDTSRFLEDVNRLVEGKEKKLTERMKGQIKELDDLIAQGGPEGEELTDSILSKTAEWMSPSWKMKAAELEEIISFVESLKRASVLDVIIAIGKGLALIVKTIVRIPLYVGLRALEYTVGREVATGIVKAIGSVIDVSMELVHAFMSPSTQAALFAAYGFYDAFHVHNFGAWINDMVSFIITGALVDRLPRLRLLQYPLTSKPVSPKKGTHDPEKMWQIDHKELAFEIDFWGKAYLDESARVRRTKPKQYKKYQNFGGIRRIPGRYIDLNNHPYDTQDEIDQCIHIENSLNLNTLVDETGELTGVDVGGHLTSNLMPKRKGFVRNLINFPLYKSGVHWPNRDGEFIQTQGADNSRSMDPSVYNIWTKYVTSGRYGLVYNHPKSSMETKQKAIKTNQRDYVRYLHPDINDDLEWGDLKTWAKSNSGKVKIISQDMHKVTLDVLEQEEKTDIKELPGMEFHEAALLLQNQDSLDFVEYQFLHTGRYLFTPQSHVFYNRVIHEKKVKIARGSWVSMGTSVPVFHREVKIRDAKPPEIAKYTRIVKQLELYKTALLNKYNSIGDAWDAALTESLWDAYIEDTSPRNMWGYIQKVRPLLIAELQHQTNVLLGTHKAEIWAKYMKSVTQLRVPLNTNRYHRLAFVGRFNQLVYSTDTERTETITSEIEQLGGNILENQLFTTGLTKGDTVSWAKEFVRTAIHIPTLNQLDIPLYFGKIHCRVIVIDKPKQTCFIVFRGTTNFWEWLVDADFSGAEYGTIKLADHPGHYSLDVSSKSETVVGDLEDIFYSDPDHFALHRGFLRCWMAFKPKLVPYLEKLYERHEIQNVIVTGHSLGAGITQIACLELPSLPVRSYNKPSSLALMGGIQPSKSQVKYYRPHAYMYSSPAVGDRRFTWHFLNQTSESAHVFIDGDLITMIPPFLMPSAETWGPMGKISFLEDLKFVSSGDAGATATIWTMISNVFKVENVSNPLAWMIRKGQLDKNKIQDKVLELFIAYNKHKADKGGGIFFRLDSDLSGDVFETSADPGSTIGAVQTLVNMLSNFSVANLKRYHSIDNVVDTLDKVASKHPDLFSVIDKEENPTWDDVVNIKPPKLNPVTPSVEKQIRKGTLIAVARSRKRYLPYQIVAREDVINESIVRVKDTDEFSRCHARQVKRRKIRKITEGDYHGY